MCETEQPDVDISTPQGARQIRHRQFQARPPRTVHVLEAEDVLFHFNSAVMMLNRPAGSSSIDGDTDPDGSSESETAETGEDVINGTRVIYAAFRFFEANPQKRLVIAGHTDTSGAASSNFELSELRARNILTVLTNDRDGWIELCQARHRVEDIQQILAWLEWYNGPLNNVMDRGTREAVLNFAAAYNQNKDAMGFPDCPEIPGDGMDGRRLCDETWGAFFDLYQFNIGSLLQCRPNTPEMYEWRERIRFIDDERRWVACGESFPIDNFGQDNYRSQQNRRVELLFFDREEVPELTCPPPGEVVHTVEACPLYRQQQYERVYVDPMTDFDTVTLDLQTVDQYSHPVGNFDLILRHNVGTEYEITTDADGFHSQAEVPVGLIRVVDSEGNPVPLAADPNRPSQIQVSAVSGSIVSLLVAEADEELVEEVERIERVYDRQPVEDTGDDLEGEWEPIYEGEGDDYPETEEVSGDDTVEQEEAEEPAPTATATHQPTPAAGRILDNLVLAAGFADASLDEAALIRLLGQYLSDYNATVRSRRFWVSMVVGGNRLKIYDHEGNQEANFNLTRTVRGPVGAYALYRIHGQVAFLDIRTRRIPLTYSGDTIESDEDGPTSLADLAAESDRERLRSIASDHVGQIEVFFNAPTGPELGTLMRRGGLGYLEVYPENTASINRHIHDRNMAVCRNVAQQYNGIIRRLEDRYQLCDSEAAIRRIGPPPRVYVYPRPPGATDSQANDLLGANIEYSDFPAWREINETLDRIANRHSEGNMFFRVKLQLNDDPRRAGVSSFGSAYVGARTEYNMDIGSDRVLTRVQHTNVAEGSFTPGVTRHRLAVGGGVSHQVNAETGETKTAIKAQIGGYGFEVDDRGGRKATGPFGTTAEYNEQTAEGASGINLSLGPLGSVYMGIGFQGLQEDTVMAFAVRAPGLFDSMPVDQLLSPRTLWCNLTSQEIPSLRVIGFEEAFWNEKHLCPIDEFPEACRQNGSDLSVDLRAAAARLRLSRTDWTSTWRRVAADPVPLDEEESGADGDV